MQHKDLLAEIIIKNITLSNYLQIYIPPPIVNRDHLTTTGKLTSENKMNEIKKKIVNDAPLNTRRYSKREFGDQFPYTVYAIPNVDNNIDIYLVYPIELVKGGSSAIHAAQNISTGQWIIAKKKNKKWQLELNIKVDKEKNEDSYIQNFSIINQQHSPIIKKKSIVYPIISNENGMNNQKRFVKPKLTKNRRGLNKSMIPSESSVAVSSLFDHRNSVPLEKTDFIVNKFSEETIILSKSISTDNRKDNRLRVEDNYLLDNNLKKKILNLAKMMKS